MVVLYEVLVDAELGQDVLAVGLDEEAAAVLVDLRLDQTWAVEARVEPPHGSCSIGPAVSSRSTVSARASGLWRSLSRSDARAAIKRRCSAGMESTRCRRSSSCPRSFLS